MKFHQVEASSHLNKTKHKLEHYYHRNIVVQAIQYFLENDFFITFSLDFTISSKHKRHKHRVHIYIIQYICIIQHNNNNNNMIEKAHAKTEDDTIKHG